jgi:uncharacterized surface protein with fasciclin (FAS1) repeats
VDGSLPLPPHHQEKLMQRHLIAAIAATLVAAAGGAHADGYGRGNIDNNAFLPASTMTMGAAPASKMVGGAAMFPTRDIIDNAVNSKDHTTLVAAVKAAGLVDTLKTPGPFTVFAPTNAAFTALPAGTVDTLLKPENKSKLAAVLTYHVVPGKLDAAALGSQIMDGKGTATLKTAAGGTLTAKESGGKIMVGDEKGGWATVSTADVYQSNGVIHVVDKVLLPK